MSRGEHLQANRMAPLGCAKTTETSEPESGSIRRIVGLFNWDLQNTSGVKACQERSKDLCGTIAGNNARTASDISKVDEFESCGMDMSSSFESRLRAAMVRRCAQIVNELQLFHVTD